MFKEVLIEASEKKLKKELSDYLYEPELDLMTDFFNFINKLKGTDYENADEIGYAVDNLTSTELKKVFNQYSTIFKQFKKEKVNQEKIDSSKMDQEEKDIKEIRKIKIKWKEESKSTRPASGTSFGGGTTFISYSFDVKKLVKKYGINAVEKAFNTRVKNGKIYKTAQKTEIYD